MNYDIKFITKLLMHQLNTFFVDVDENVIKDSIERALQDVEESIRKLASNKYNDSDNIIFNPYHSVSWMIFLYRLSWHIAHDNEEIPKEADMVYYLNKIMHSTDWFYMVNLPTHFYCEHPLGCILGRAEYSDYLMVYQGVTVGGNRTSGKLYYPKIGKNVCMYVC